MKKYDWDAALDDLKRLEGLKNDSALAKTLGVSAVFISYLRSGKKKLPIELCKRILLRLGFEPHDPQLLDEMLRDKISISDPAPNKELVEMARNRANGKCELCGVTPFMLPSGKPYLEVHHAVTGSKEVPAESYFVLCPNCHRKVHVVLEEADQKKLAETIRKKGQQKT